MREELSAFKKKHKVPAIIGYLPALHPDTAEAENVLRQAYDAGLRFIETGFPTPDPYFDGEVIRNALLELERRKQTVKDMITKSGGYLANTGLTGIAMLYEKTYDAKHFEIGSGDCLKRKRRFFRVDFGRALFLLTITACM